MSGRGRHLLSLLAVAILGILHNDWLWPSPAANVVFGGGGRAVFGWFPAEMAYRVIWLVLGCVVCAFIVRNTWRHKP